MPWSITAAAGMALDLGGVNRSFVNVRPLAVGASAAFFSWVLGSSTRVSNGELSMGFKVTGPVSKSMSKSLNGDDSTYFDAADDSGG